MAFSINNPDSLTDKEWAKLIGEYTYVKQLEYRNMEVVFKKSLAEILGKMFGKE